MNNESTPNLFTRPSQITLSQRFINQCNVYKCQFTVKAAVIIIMFPDPNLFLDIY